MTHGRGLTAGDTYCCLKYKSGVSFESPQSVGNDADNEDEDDDEDEDEDEDNVDSVRCEQCSTSANQTA